MLDALIEHAQGQPASPEVTQLLASATADENTLWGMRRKADVLAASAHAPRLLQPLGTEVFRSQNEFNHAVVDVLEDLPWLAGRPEAPQVIAGRLGRWQRFSARTPRKPGLRQGAVALTKTMALLTAERVHRPLLEALFEANQAVTRALIALAQGKPAPAAPAPWRVREVAAEFAWWTEAQLCFLGALERFIASHGRQLASWAAAYRALAVPLPAPGGHPSVSVLVVGSGTPPPIDGALEVLFESAPPPHVPNARQGDAGDARGEVLVRLPTHDTVLPGGLAALARPFADPAVELAWGDAVLPDGNVALRPAWSPETLWSWTFTGSCIAVRTGVARRAQLSRRKPVLEWLLVPGFTEKSAVRVPAVVSRATPVAPSVAEAAVVEADLRRRAAPGVVKLKGALREVRLLPRPGTRVSIIVPFRDKPELLEALWRSLLRFDAGVDWELILADNGSVERATARFLATLGDPRVHRIRWNHPFHFSRLNNEAARHARGDLLLFLNNDITVQQDDWLADLAGYAQLPEVGAVGARLLYPDGSLQHGGVVIGLKGLAGHAFARWRPEYGATPFGPPEATRNWSAVTGACLLMRREVFDRVGGFDEGLAVSGGDIALCLAARRLGLRVVNVGHVALVHHESQSRGRSPVPAGDVRRELVVYRELLGATDPYSHPLLSTEAAHGGPGPRVEDPVEHVARAIAPWL